MKVFAPLLIVTCLLIHWVHIYYYAVPLAKPKNYHETFPSAEALKFMSLGYTNLAADYYWLKAISHFGTTAMHDKNYPNLIPLIERVLALDPYFASAYFFAGTALTVKGIDPTHSTKLLKQGMRYRPDVWRIPFYLGFNAYYFNGDYVTAAHAMAQAAQFPEAPPITAKLATRLAAEAGAPEIGLRLIETILKDIQDPKLRQSYQERQKLLRLEVELKVLEKMVKHFQTQFKRPVKSMKDLVRPGYLQSTPVDPLGEAYYLDADGMIKTTHEEQRLRLTNMAKGKNP